MSIGLPLHVISTSSSLCTVTSSLVKIDVFPSSANLPTLRSEFLKSSNMSARVALSDIPLNGSQVVFTSLLAQPFSTPTRIVDFFNIRILDFFGRPRKCNVRRYGSRRVLTLAQSFVVDASAPCVILVLGFVPGRPPLDNFVFHLLTDRIALSFQVELLLELLFSFELLPRTRHSVCAVVC